MNHTLCTHVLCLGLRGPRKENSISWSYLHTLAELYAVLTTIPVKPMISPVTAWRLIHENVETSATIITLSRSDYSSTIKFMAEFGLCGGVIYDALIAKAARKSGVERLMTFNIDDFKRVWPEGEPLLCVP